MAIELGRELSVDEVAEIFLFHFAEVFDMELVESPAEMMTGGGRG